MRQRTHMTKCKVLIQIQWTSLRSSNKNLQNGRTSIHRATCNYNWTDSNQPNTTFLKQIISELPRVWQADEGRYIFYMQTKSETQQHTTRSSSTFYRDSLYKYFTSNHIATTRTIIPITDESRHMQEQPALVRLFRIARFLCTRCGK